MFVLDCSVAMSWFLPDEELTSVELLHRVINYGALVPSVWQLEIANVLISACKKERITMDNCLSVLDELKNLPIKIQGPFHNKVFCNIVDLAKKFNLTSYDSSYLELAVRYDVPLATFDKKLVIACNSLNIQVL